MTRMLLLATVLIVLAHAASAQLVTLAQSGIWTAQAYRQADEAVCSVGAQIGNGTPFVSDDSRNPYSIFVSITPTDLTCQMDPYTRRWWLPEELRNTYREPAGMAKPSFPSAKQRWLPGSTNSLPDPQASYILTASHPSPSI